MTIKKKGRTGLLAVGLAFELIFQSLKISTTGEGAIGHQRSRSFKELQMYLLVQTRLALSVTAQNAVIHRPVWASNMVGWCEANARARRVPAQTAEKTSGCQHIAQCSSHFQNSHQQHHPAWSLGAPESSRTARLCSSDKSM